MLIEIRKVQKEYSRTSKKGHRHKFVRTHDVALLKCDCCSRVFERRARSMDHRRLNDQHTHVCASCEPKKYAQKKSAESRRFWNTTVDLDRDIDSI